MRVAFLVCSALVSTCALGDAFIYQPNAATVFNSGVEVQASAGSVQGPQSGTGTINANFTSTYSLSQSVSSSASQGIGSATANASISMNANLTGESISGTGTLTGNATLGGGPLGGATVLTDGSADFEIYFTLNNPERISLDFTASTKDTVANPNNDAVVFLQGLPAFDLLFRAESTGTGSQNVTWSGVLAAGDYWLRGRDAIDDIPITNNNDPPLYDSQESFAFSLQATSVPEPGTLALWVAGLLAVMGVQRRRLRRLRCQAAPCIKRANNQ